MQKAKSAAIGLGQRGPVGTSFFKQREGSVDVRADEIVGAVNRSVDVALSCEMNDGARLFASEQSGEGFAVQNMAALETVVRVSFDCVQVVEIAGVSELVEIDDARVLGGNPLEDKVGADKASA